MPEDAVDVWEACGRQQDHQYTWDTTVNDNLGLGYDSEVTLQQSPPRFRFDRVYLNPDDGALKPKCFKLVGKERLPCGQFPSDHWGLWVEFQLE